MRKRALLSDAMSHAALPGIAGAFLLATAFGSDPRSLPVLLLGAAIASVLSVLAVQGILRYTRLHEDAAIGIVLSVAFGIGIVLLSLIQRNAPQNAAGLHHFIYGQTAAMRIPDALTMAGAALLATAVLVLFLKETTLVCFDDAFARTTGWPVSLIDLGMMGAVTVVVVAGLQAVGILLIIAMLTIPPVAARFWTERLARLAILSGLIGALSGYLGSSLSALLPRVPAGAVIVLTSGGLFTVSFLLAPTRGVIATALRHARLRLRIARDHLLEAAHDTGPRADGSTVLSKAALDRVARERGWRPGVRTFILALLRLSGESRPASGDLALTKAGQVRGARVARNHRLWEQYLITYADIAPSHVDWSVDQVEHVLSDPLIRELETALKKQGIAVPPAAHSADPAREPRP
jgi:manganese/zinc/iron transport system permease protein